jgi:GntR family transcriptional regulator, transcriptional repressor for pyruvate dehydrogenase complex
MYKQIRPRKIYEEVADQIKKMILSKQLKSGEKLASIEELAESFQVGRAAVREALSALQAMGLVEMRQGEGTFVSQYDPSRLVQNLSITQFMNKQDLIELLEVRKIIDVGSVSLAAMRWEGQDLIPIQEALQQMREAIGDKELGEAADLAFHLSIAKAAHNKMLLGLMDMISGTMMESMRETRQLYIYGEESSAERLLAEHEKIYEAIANRQPEEAEKSMIEHLNNVEAIIRRHLFKN